MTMPSRRMHRYSDEAVARVCHAAIAELIRQCGAVPPPDFSFMAAAQRNASVESVRLARNGLPPRERHAQWVAAMAEAGWTWGAERDPAAKTHPAMVRYDDLPAAQRDADRMFLMIVTALTDTT